MHDKNHLTILLFTVQQCFHIDFHKLTLYTVFACPGYYSKRPNIPGCSRVKMFFKNVSFLACGSHDIYILFRYRKRTVTSF